MQCHSSRFQIHTLRPVPIDGSSNQTPRTAGTIHIPKLQTDVEPKNEEDHDLIH